MFNFLSVLCLNLYFCFLSLFFVIVTNANVITLFRYPTHSRQDCKHCKTTAKITKKTVTWAKDKEYTDFDSEQKSAFT